MGNKVYGSLQSTCTQRVILVLLELGVSYEFSEVVMQKGEHKDRAFIENYHPFGLIPVLDDNNFRLFESRAISRYLVAKHGGAGTPLSSGYGDPMEVGRFEEALSVEYCNFHPPMKTLSYELLFKRFMGHGDPEPTQVQQARDLLRTTLDYYERLLSKQSYLAGNVFGLVDIFHMPWVHFLSRLQLDGEIKSRPNFRGWWERASSRPSWQALLKLDQSHG